MFVQTIEIHTSNFAPIQRAMQAYVEATEGIRTVVRSAVLHDRDDATRYVVMVEFDSAEAAERNDAMPATADLARVISYCAEAPLVFRNHDVFYAHD